MPSKGGSDIEAAAAAAGVGTDTEAATGGAILRDGEPDPETEPDADGDDTADGAADDGTESGCGSGGSVLLTTLASSSLPLCFSWGADSLLFTDPTLTLLSPTVVVGKFSETAVSVVVSVVGVEHSALTIAEVRWYH